MGGSEKGKLVLQGFPDSPMKIVRVTASSGADFDFARGAGDRLNRRTLSRCGGI